MEIRDQRPTLTWRAAHVAAGAALEEAERLGVSVAVTVCDSAGVTAAQLRMPGAPFHCASIAEDKAYTAAAFRLATVAWADVMATLTAEVQAGLRARPRFVTFGGGLPIVDRGDLLGGIGVSGASEAQDEAIARAGLGALSLT